MEYEIKNKLTGPVVLYDCPRCACALKSNLKNAGKMDECAECGMRFIVPGEAEVKAEKEEAERKEVERKKAEAASVVEVLPSPPPLHVVDPSDNSGGGLGLTESQKARLSPVDSLWAGAVVALYVLLTVAMWIIPVCVLLGTDFETHDRWILGFVWVAVVVSQVVLIFIPFRFANRRPSRRSSLWPTLLATSFLSGLLVFGAFYSLWELSNNQYFDGWGIFIPVFITWIIWPVIFWFASSNADPQTFAFRLYRLVIKGGVIELLIAVPAHIIVRARKECSAGFATFTGLCLGLGVMFVAFGPGVLLLYYRKIKAKQIPRLPTEASAAGVGTEWLWNCLCLLVVILAIVAAISTFF